MSHAPQGSVNDSPKCSATCACRHRLVSANATIRSTRAIAAARGTFEELLDDGSGLRADGRELDLHHPARVVSAADDARLLEHPDEDAGIVVSGREPGRVDGTSLRAHRAVDVSKVVRLGDVAHREATHGCRVGRACEE